MHVPKPKILIVPLLLAASLAFAAPATDLPFGAWRRALNEPILSPQGRTWESAGTFNPAVTFFRAKDANKQDPGKFVMLYRAQDAAGTSRLGYAESIDGIHFTRRADPVLSPETGYEKDGGVEDPRLQKFGDTFYLTYTGYNKKDAQLCLATSRDLIHWERKGVILPAYKGNWNVAWTKSGAIVPEKIDGKYWMYWLGTAADKTDQMGLSYSTDLIHWTSPVLHRSSHRAASCWSTTAPTTNLCTAPASRSSIARIPASSSRDPMSPSSPRKKNGRASGKCQTLFSLRASCDRAGGGSFTTAERTNM
jgi:hypothetical protein